MLERRVGELMRPAAGLSLPPSATVEEAACRMAEQDFGALMVVEADALVGIFTERDAVFRVIARGLDARTTRLGEVMTAAPRTVTPGDTFGYALVLMQEGGFRHAPVVEAGRPLGVITSRNALDPELEEFVTESNRRRHLRAGH